jgi:hypothetical protein
MHNVHNFLIHKKLTNQRDLRQNIQNIHGFDKNAVVSTYFMLNIQLHELMCENPK